MRILITLLTLALLLTSTFGLIHNLHIKHDDRHLFKIETFGFLEGGVVNVTIHDFNILSAAHIPVNKDHKEELKIGFLLRKSNTAMHAQQDVETFVEKQMCILDDSARHPDDIFIDLSVKSSWKRTTFSRVIQEHQAGLYSLIFARCHSIDSRPSSAYIKSVSFSLHASFHNPGPNYLSAGDVPLPSVYFCFFLLFGAAGGYWCFLLGQPQATNGKVHHVHFMMSMLVGVKAISLLLESIRYHSIASRGVSHLWSDLYYIFAAIKGIMLFVVILLIGTGWSLMKGYLNSKEKRIVMAVLAMQIVNNIAMVVIEESAPGSKSWLAWRDMLHIVDILCCCAILFPIVWNIRQLRQASEVDGKAQANLAKLKQFRQFYVMVIVYIYFTRIGIDYLLEASVPYSLLWLGPTASEATTLAFFILTGAAFRPSPTNSYLSVKQEEDDDEDEQVSVNVRSATGGTYGHGHDAAATVRSEEENAMESEYGLNSKKGGGKQRDVEMGSLKK